MDWEILDNSDSQTLRLYDPELGLRLSVNRDRCFALTPVGGTLHFCDLGTFMVGLQMARVMAYQHFQAAPER